MESLYYNLSEEEFSNGRKTLLWVFAGLFFLSGMFILIKSFILGHDALPAVLSLAPFGISLIVFVIAVFASIKRTDLFFSVNDEEIEFRYGIINPKKYTFKWNEIAELKMPSKQKKAMLLFKNGNTFVINLTWLQRKKSSLIRKHIYYAARSKDLKVTKVNML
jgi:hypothetical protein